MSKSRGRRPAFLALMALALIPRLVFSAASASRAGSESVPQAKPAGASLTFEVAQTALFVKDPAGGLKQLFSVSVDNPGAAIEVAELTVRLGGRDYIFPLGALPQGKSVHSVPLPEIAKPARATFILKAGASTLRKDAALKPGRKWTVYLFHHSHTDIGYTELQTRVAANHVDYLDSVIDYCRETDAYPDDAKFRWNIEVSWSLQNFLRTRPEARVRQLAALIKTGRVELSGLYLNQSDGFSHEEIVRSVDFAAEIARRYGFDVVSAMNNDVTGFDWALPQVFRQAGIKYFATGINETRSRAPLRRPCAFWWESPDGSRILHWNGEHYLFANYDLLLHEPLAKSSPKVGDYLAKLEARGDYPEDLIAFNIGAWTTDNCPPGRALSDRVKEWNEAYAFPKLRLATMREFFGALETKYGAGLAVYKLGWPDYWTDGVASTSYETGLNRLTHNELIAAEKWSAAARVLGADLAYPEADIRDAYDLAMLYDEHTWGAYNSIDEPWSELARGQWTLKSAYAYKAREASRTMLRRGLAAVAGLIAAEGDYEFAVFNSLSWPRTDVVRVTLPAGPLREAKGKLRVIDRRTASEAKFQMEGDDTLLVLAKDVPSLGYAVFTVTPATGAGNQGGPAGSAGSAPSPAADGAGTGPGSGLSSHDARGPCDPDPAQAQEAGVPNVIENRFYRVTVDLKTGGIASILDKETGREIVDDSCPWPLNTYIYEQPEGGRPAVDDMKKRAVFHRWTPESARIEAGPRGPVAASLIVRSSARMCPSLEQRIVLYEDVKRIDLMNLVDKEETFAPEAVYFSFPFAVGPGLPSGETAKPVGKPGRKPGAQPSQAVGAAGGPAVRFEISDADMAPETEQLPGTTRDWHTVQHWVEFAGRDARVVWSPVEAPLVEFGDINTGKWLTKLDIMNARVFSYAMNNYWMTNFKASQEGRIPFRYALTSGLPVPAAEGTGGSDRVAASRFGWEVHTPLAAAWIPAKNKGRLAAPAQSLITVDAPNVIIQAFMLEGGLMPLVRLREIGGKAVEVHVATPALLMQGRSAVPNRAGGGALVSGGIAPSAGQVVVSLKPFEIRTVKLMKPAS